MPVYSQIATDAFTSAVSGNWTVTTSGGGLPVWVTGGYADLGAGKAFWNAGTFSNDQYSSVTIQNHARNTGNLNECWTTVRHSGASSLYYAAVISTDNGYGITDKYKLLEVDGSDSSETTLATAGTPAALALGDIAYLQVNGTAIALYTDESGSGLVSRVTATDATVTTGRPGLGGYDEETGSDRMLVTSWEGGDLGVNVAAGSVQVTKYNPTVTVGSTVAVSVGVKSVQITKYSPTITVNHAVAVGVKSVQITKYNPTVSVGGTVAVSVGVKSVQVTKYNPSISVGSGPLTINSSAVTVRENGHSVRYEPLADHPVRNYRGTCISAITTARGYRRIWSMQTPPMTTAVAACFEADVSTGDLFTVTGYLVGSTTVTAAIANIQRDDEPLFASFSFDLIESL